IVTATSADGSTAAQTFTIAINDVNEFAVSTPVDSDNASNAVDENVEIGRASGREGVETEADAATNSDSYAITGGTGLGLFAIGATGGVGIRARTVTEVPPCARPIIIVTATSADGSTAAQTFTIAINDVNEFAVSTPVDSDNASNAVDENV